MKLKTVLLPALLLQAGMVVSQIPILNSNPTISDRVIYLDFDGQKVTGTSWNNGNTINAQPSTASNANIRTIFQRVSEDYRPFNVNVTTDSTRFNNAIPNSRIRVVFTPTSAWYTTPAGGVAYLNSFTWGGYPGTPCWIFEDQLGYSAKNMAEAAAHEAGHTLSLYHQSTYSSATCSKTAEYNPGLGNGVTSWAPIMGVGYSKNVTIWHNGTNANGCNTYQNDHSGGSPGITGGAFLSYLPDDVGNTVNTGKILNLTTLNTVDSGIISTPADFDLYRFTICNTRFVTLNVKPWALDTSTGSNGYQGANLDVKLKLYNATTNSLIAGDSTLSRLYGIVGANLTAGSYYFTIDGDASSNYPDYGSLGKYYMYIKATNPPQIASSIVTTSALCSGSNNTLTSNTSSGTPTGWQWNITGPSSATFNISNPTYNFSPAGIYTVVLITSNSTYTSCPVTRTINIGVAPNLSIYGAGSVLCPQTSATLSATGATSYTWLPGNYANATILVSPTSNTTYTLIGSNGSCANNTVATVTVGPNFNLSATTNTTFLCAGSAATITASGASAYTLQPGGQTTNPFVVSPQSTTNFTVNGGSNGCVKKAVVSISVNPVFFITVFSSTDQACPGDPVTLNNFGAFNYTVNPGGYTGNPIVVTPTATTTFTVIGSDAAQCLADTTVDVFILNCNVDGLSANTANDNYKIYPNPSSTFFTIESANEPFSLEVYNTLGSVVYRTGSSANKAEVNVANWNKGIYFIKTNVGNGTSHLQKILVE